MAFCLRQNMLIRKNVNPRQSDHNEKPLILGLLSRIICVNSTCIRITAVISLSYHIIYLLPYQRELLDEKISQKSYSSVTGEFPSQRPVTQSFDVFFDLHLNKRLSKQS